VFLEVADDGCGMSPELVARIFDPFFTTKARGRGLGLSSVQGIVRAHGGTLRTTSVPGRGTTFRVLWPAAGRPDEAQPPCPSPTRRPGLVLLIDDEPIVRGVASRALGRLGLRVLCASGGQEGLDLFAEHRDEIALVLLDFGMPGMDGAETFRRLTEIRPDVTVILSSGCEDTRPVGRRGARPVAFLPKPYTVSALLELVGNILPSRPPAATLPSGSSNADPERMPTPRGGRVG
jgi:CheY-like chemotaxis protein